MNSIRGKIQSTIVGSVLVVGLCMVLVFVVSQLNVYKNQQIIETMTTEYGIISLTENLISTYNDVVKNPGNAQFTTRYAELRKSLEVTMTTLRTTIVSKDSKVVLLGVENNIKKVIYECDKGISEVNENNFQNFSARFATAHKHKEFVVSNTSSLLQKELEYLSETQNNTRKLYVLGIAVTSLIFVVVIVSTIAFAKSASKQLIQPIEDLTKTVELVALGNLEMTIGDKLLQEKNEVGILAKSFGMMMGTIKEKIVLLDKSNKELSDSKNVLETNNGQLEKLNKFMVDRELKMIELKKQIVELKTGKKPKKRASVKV